MRGATHHVGGFLVQQTISIHAPRAGRDAANDLPIWRSKVFQSTRPVRGATRRRWRSGCCGHCHFNPRAPCGARPAGGYSAGGWRSFQSTRPVRGATWLNMAQCEKVIISIHAPRAGRDWRPDLIVCDDLEFQSTRPVRGATQDMAGGRAEGDISIHAPRAGRDVGTWSRPSSTRYFNPRAPCGARPWCACRAPGSRYFNPRAPCGARPRPPCPYSLAFVFQSTRPVRGATGRKPI